uniref:Adiponectin receptor n=1 Tax=Romanomermis culicivorax TaxID=13658 RepID=A0A915JBJ7_ROMCU
MSLSSAELDRLLIDFANSPTYLNGKIKSKEENHAPPKEQFNCFPTFEEAKEQAVHFAEKIWECAHFRSLPEWLQDNDFLHQGHRPQLPSFSACMLSVFRIHTETGNIWSHMLGCLLFVAITAYIYTRPHHEIHLEKKFVFMPFLLGAVICMAFSSAFHTMYCHSLRIHKIFLKLDYVGISLLIMGSSIPWLYYSFYCRIEPKIVYISLISFLGVACILISFCETFSAPNYRHLRAGVFISFGCCGIIPLIHYFITDGIHAAFAESAFGWLILMALIYLFGALLYAFRVPERFFPGKCDIWFQSHQLFHLLVVVAAFVNYHGINVLAVSRISGRSCEEQLSTNPVATTPNDVATLSGSSWCAN